jgi:hypothetical protein
MKRATIRCNIDEITLMKCRELSKILSKFYVTLANRAAHLFADL